MSPDYFLGVWAVWLAWRHTTRRPPDRKQFADATYNQTLMAAFYTCFTEFRLTVHRQTAVPSTVPSRQM